MSNFTKSMSYSMLNKSSSISSMIKKTIKEYTEVDISKISGQMIDMEYTPLNRSVMKMMQGKNSSNHHLKMMTASDQKIVTMVLPFATYRAGSNVVTMAYIDNIGKVTGDKVVASTNALYAMLGGAYIANSVFDSYSELTNRDIMIPLMNIYVDMVMGVFNVVVHARADKKLSDIITYGARRFFLENMLNIDDSDAVANIAIKGLNNIDQGEYEKANLMYADAAVKDGTLDDWINWSKKISSKTANMSVKLFIEKWIRQYGEYSYFAMDNVEYLIGSILMTLATVNGYSRQLHTLIKNSKSINKLHATLYSFGE